MDSLSYYCETAIERDGILGIDYEILLSIMSSISSIFSAKHSILIVYTFPYSFLKGMCCKSGAISIKTLSDINLGAPSNLKVKTLFVDLTKYKR